MSKVTLEFDLPEEREDFNVAFRAAHLDRVICELDTYLRRKIKYEELTEEQYKLYQEIRDKLQDLNSNE